MTTSDHDPRTILQLDELEADLPAVLARHT